MCNSPRALRSGIALSLSGPISAEVHCVPMGGRLGMQRHFWNWGSDVTAGDFPRGRQPGIGERASARPTSGINCRMALFYLGNQYKYELPSVINGAVKLPRPVDALWVSPSFRRFCCFPYSLCCPCSFFPLIPRHSGGKVHSACFFDQFFLLSPVSRGWPFWWRAAQRQRGQGGL